MNGFIDIYCERTAAGLLNEPLNAFSNLAFFIAAYFAYRLARHERLLDGGISFLLVLLLVIGTGSTLFHTLATGWAQMADVFPILLFQIGFIYLYGRRGMGFGQGGMLLLLTGFFMAVFCVSFVPPDMLNGSVSYVPAFLFLGGLGVYHWRTGQREPYILLGAAVLFAVSLMFRTMDMALCESFPAGLHFIWHILNGVLLYLCLRGLLRTM